MMMMIRLVDGNLAANHSAYFLLISMCHIVLYGRVTSTRLGGNQSQNLIAANFLLKCNFCLYIEDVDFSL